MFTITKPRPATISDAGRLAAERIPFAAGGRAYGVANLRGGPTEHTLGRLSPVHIERYLADADEIDYVVYSYRTPIAWHTPAGWVTPQAKYTPSTSRHQSALFILVSATF